MENSEFVNLPSRRVKPGQQFPAEANGEVFHTTVKMFSMENVSEHLLYRKKKIAREFGEEGDDEDDDRNAFRNQLAILESEPEVITERNSQEMERWLRKLHIETHRAIREATPATTNRIDAISHVSKTASRLKGNACSNTSGKVHSQSQLHRSTATAGTTTTQITENTAEDNHIVATRSKRATKQTTEPRGRTKHNKTSRNSGEQSISEKPTTSETGPAIRLS
ncbi:uncharacterized protein LOC116918899 [Daphnia magna]|uniref:Uncharacterized protein n=2 Tax=Daphnia magna TaxID=35525 RepID=A0ABR0AFY5_9CRUS|nr:uncharacterized protein LOC116918899 [Daphnia magna]KAK4024044.1 hypothetical protein OUZ56_009435 [Daphnia magna]